MPLKHPRRPGTDIEAVGKLLSRKTGAIKTGRRARERPSTPPRRTYRPYADTHPRTYAIRP